MFRPIASKVTRRIVRSAKGSTSLTREPFVPRTSTFAGLLICILACSLLIVGDAAGGTSNAKSQAGATPNPTDVGIQNVYIHWPDGKTETVFFGRTARPSRIQALENAQIVANERAKAENRPAPTILSSVLHTTRQTASARRLSSCDAEYCISVCDGWIDGPSHGNGVAEAWSGTYCSDDVYWISLDQWLYKDGWRSRPGTAVTWPAP